MKKVLWLAVCLMTMVVFTSCTPKYLVSAKYEICYPDGTRVYEDSIKVASYATPKVLCHSVAGTNYVSAASMSYDKNTFNERDVKKRNHIASSTAPMRLVEYKTKKIWGGGYRKSITIGEKC